MLLSTLLLSTLAEELLLSTPVEEDARRGMQKLPTPAEVDQPPLRLDHGHVDGAHLHHAASLPLHGRFSVHALVNRFVFGVRDEGDV